MRSKDSRFPELDSSENHRLLDAFISVGIGVVFIILYNATLLAGTGFQVDTTKYHFIGKVLGISHPPGSPLYILINWFVAQIPIGELAWRINLMSAVFAVLTLITCYHLFKYLCTSRISAFTTTIILGLARTFWQQSIIAEVYTLHLLLVIVATFFIFKWCKNDSRKYLALGTLCFGLSFGVHLSSAFFIPGFALLLFKKRFAILRSTSGIIIVTTSALVGMSTHLYYAIRPKFNPVFAEYNIRSISDFFVFISGGYFRKSMFAFNTDQMINEQLPWLLNALITNLGLFSLITGIIGLALLAIRHWQFGIYLLVPFGISILYSMGYDVHDPEVFLLPALVILCSGIAYAFSGAIKLARSPGIVKSWLSIIGISLLTTLIIVEHFDQFRTNYVQLDLSHGQYIVAQSNKALESVSSPATIFTGRSYPMLLFGYSLWGLENRRGEEIDLKPLNWRDCAEVDENISSLFNTRNLYLTREFSTCLSSGDYVLESWDFSRTLYDYLNEAPNGRLFALAINDEGTAGIKANEWDKLIKLGITPELRGKFRWSYSGILIKRDGKLAGVQKVHESGCEISLQRGERIITESKAPFNINIVSGGNTSGKEISIRINGKEYSRFGRGIQVVTFDASTGIQIDRKVFDTHRSTSLREYYFFKISQFQPYLRSPPGKTIDLSAILATNDGYLSFALQPAQQRKMTVELYIVSDQLPRITNIFESQEIAESSMQVITGDLARKQIPSLRVKRNEDIYLLTYSESNEKLNISLQFGRSSRNVYGVIRELESRPDSYSISRKF